MNGYGFEIYGGRARATFNDGKLKLFPADVAKPGEWQHIALTWGGGRITLYQDGCEVKWAPFSGKPKADTRELYVGARWTGHGREFVGEMDDILIQGRCLKPEDISRIARLGISQGLVEADGTPQLQD